MRFMFLPHSALINTVCPSRRYSTLTRQRVGLRAEIYISDSSREILTELYVQHKALRCVILSSIVRKNRTS